MRYYAHYGHDEFILCLGYRADMVKEFFLGYNEALFSDVTVSDGGQSVEYLEDHVQNWRVTLVDTGINSNIGERLRMVADHVVDDEMFLANYSDGLTDFCLPRLIESFTARDSYAGFLSVQPRTSSLDTVQAGEDGTVSAIKCMKDSGIWVNGGYFVMRKEIFRYLKPGEEIVYEPFRRLIAEGKVWSPRYEGFWQCLDTFKDKQILDELEASGKAPWCVWKNGVQTAAARVVA